MRELALAQGEYLVEISAAASRGSEAGLRSNALAVDGGFAASGASCGDDEDAYWSNPAWGADTSQEGHPDCTPTDASTVPILSVQV